MKEITALITVAILIEAIVEILKGAYGNKSMFLSLVIGVVFALATQLDVLALLGVESVVPYLGQVATGIVISRGSNFVHDLVDKLTNNKVQPEIEED